MGRQSKWKLLKRYSSQNWIGKWLGGCAPPNHGCVAVVHWGSGSLVLVIDGGPSGQMIMFLADIPTFHLNENEIE